MLAGSSRIVNPSIFHLPPVQTNGTNVGINEGTGERCTFVLGAGVWGEWEYADLRTQSFSHAR